MSNSEPGNSEPNNPPSVKAGGRFSKIFRRIADVPNKRVERAVTEALNDNSAVEPSLPKQRSSVLDPKPDKPFFAARQGLTDLYYTPQDNADITWLGKHAVTGDDVVSAITQNQVYSDERAIHERLNNPQ